MSSSKATQVHRTKEKHAASGKLRSSMVFKTIGITKIKDSGVLTPGSTSGHVTQNHSNTNLKDNILRPRTSKPETAQPIPRREVQSGGVSSSQSSKNFLQSQRLSPKMRVSDNLEEIYQDPKKKPAILFSKTGGVSPKAIPRRKEEGSSLQTHDNRREDKFKEEIKKSLAHVINVYYVDKKHSPLDVSLTGPTDVDSPSSDNTVSKPDFNFIEVIGRGGYGKVWKVEHKKTHKLYAMKEMSKAVIVIKKSAEGVQNERRLLSRLNHPFIANMIAAFHDRETLYLAMDLMPGGDLRYHIGEHHTFSEQQTRFFVACILTALDYLHHKKIIHRDIKPENLVLDSKGYVHVTDFGIAKIERDNTERDTSGTPGYMAPQVLCKQPHSYCADYFAIGVIAYEFMIGRRPYLGKSRHQIRQAVLAKQVQIKKSQIPPGWSMEAADFVNKLLQRQPKSRLGSKGGVSQLKEHPWLKKYQWKKLLNKQLVAPFIPEQPQYLQGSDYEDYDEGVMQYKVLERLDDQKDLFADYNHKMVAS